MIGSLKKNNPTIALNILYTKVKKLLPAYISNHNSTCEKKLFYYCFQTEKKKDGIILQ